MSRIFRVTLWGVDDALVKNVPGVDDALVKNVPVQSVSPSSDHFYLNVLDFLMNEILQDSPNFKVTLYKDDRIVEQGSTFEELADEGTDEILLNVLFDRLSFKDFDFPVKTIVYMDEIYQSKARLVWRDEEYGKPLAIFEGSYQDRQEYVEYSTPVRWPCISEVLQTTGVEEMSRLVQTDQTVLRQNFQGLFEVWHPNGKRKLLVDTKKGVAFEWSETGQLKRTVKYKFGYEIERVSFAEEGYKAFEIIRGDDILPSPYSQRTSYYKTGQIRKVEPFLNGKLHGRVREFHENGQLKNSRIFYHGNLLDRNSIGNGVKKALARIGTLCY